MKYIIFFYVIIIILSCSVLSSKNIKSSNDDNLFNTEIFINGYKFSHIDKNSISEKLDFKKKIDSEGTVRYYNGNSFIQFYKDEIEFIYVSDNKIKFDNPKVEINQNINEILSINFFSKSLPFQTTFNNINCIAVECLDMNENIITIYYVTNKIIGFTYSNNSNL